MRDIRAAAIDGQEPQIVGFTPCSMLQRWTRWRAGDAPFGREHACAGRFAAQKADTGECALYLISPPAYAELRARRAPLPEPEITTAAAA